MKEPHQNINYFKNNYYKFKVEPFELSECDYFNEDDIGKLSDISDSDYLLKFKISPKLYTFCIKGDRQFDDQVVVDIDDYVMTVMQLSGKRERSNQFENLPSFAHSFAIPERIKLNQIKLYAKGNILFIIIPRS